MTRRTAQLAVAQTPQKASVETVMQLQVLVIVFTETIVQRKLNIENKKKPDSDIYILKSGSVSPRYGVSSKARQDAQNIQTPNCK